MARYTRVKIVKGKKGLLYYLGDGLWFGRISEDKALDGLRSGKYSLWERKISKGWARSNRAR